MPAVGYYDNRQPMGPVLSQGQSQAWAGGHAPQVGPLQGCGGAGVLLPKLLAYRVLGFQFFVSFFT
jgi:hypothetical protein